MLLQTIKENVALTKSERLEILKNAKGGTWSDDWKPYCLMCKSMKRMYQMDYGFRCCECGNMIGWNLVRLQESPTNRK